MARISFTPQAYRPSTPPLSPTSPTSPTRRDSSTYPTKLRRRDKSGHHHHRSVSSHDLSLHPLPENFLGSIHKAFPKIDTGYQINTEISQDSSWSEEILHSVFESSDSESLATPPLSPVRKTSVLSNFPLPPPRFSTLSREEQDLKMEALRQAQENLLTARRLSLEAANRVKEAGLESQLASVRIMELQMKARVLSRGEGSSAENPESGLGLGLGW